MGKKTENRLSKRVIHDAPITHESPESGLFSSAKMCNFSKDGLYFESNMFLKPGEEAFIGFEDSPYSPAANDYQCLHAEIKWRKELENSEYKYGYGCKYTHRDVSAHDSKMIDNGKKNRKKNMKTSTAKSDKDDRRHQRIPSFKPVKYFGKKGMYDGIIKNICRSGAFIKTEHDFSIGQKLTLALPFIKKDQNAMVKGEVIWINGEGFGVKFKKIKEKAAA